jgi:hypothetical protein
MRKSISLCLDPEIVKVIQDRSRKHHLPASRIVEEILRKAFRLWMGSARYAIYYKVGQWIHRFLVNKQFRFRCKVNDIEGKCRKCGKELVLGKYAWGSFLPFRSDISNRPEHFTRMPFLCKSCYEVLLLWIFGILFLGWMVLPGSVMLVGWLMPFYWACSLRLG